MSSCGRHFMGNARPGMSFMFSMLPPVMSRWTLLSVISQLANGVISTSKEAITEGFVSVVFGLEYLTRALMAGYILIEFRDMFFNGRIRSLATWVTGVTRDTLRAESRGLMPPNAGSSPKDSRRFIPEGT